MLRREAGKRLLGVVLLSDGASGPTPRAICRRRPPPPGCSTSAITLFTFPFGQSRGLGEAKDVAVKDLVVNPTVFVKNELTITARSASTATSTSISRSAAVRDPAGQDGSRRPADRSAPRPTANSCRSNCSYIPQVPGEYKLTLEAVPQPGELVTTNNELSTFVNVLKRRAERALHRRGVAGRRRSSSAARSTPRPTSRSITCGSIPGDPQRRPADFADRFKPGKYDVYILGDVDSTAFHGDELARLANCVSRGAGLIMLGGFQTFGPGGYDDTPLAKVLPVGMDRLERQQPDEPVRHRSALARPAEHAAHAAGADALRR